MNATDRIFCHDGASKHPYRFECLRCGAFRDVKTPISVSDYSSEYEKFLKEHNCEEEKKND